MSDQEDEAAVLAAALTGMFRTLESRPVPEHIQRVVDQLDAFNADPALTPSPLPPSSPEP